MPERLNRKSPRHIRLWRKFAPYAVPVQTWRNRLQKNDRKHNQPRSLPPLGPDQLAADVAAGVGADVAAVDASRQSLKLLPPLLRRDLFRSCPLNRRTKSFRTLERQKSQP